MEDMRHTLDEKICQVAVDMDQKHKDILVEYRNLLSKNLILTDDFYRVLETHGVFSAPLIKDIQKAPRGESANKLLELLSTRTTTGFGKFCDVLEVTGHHLLSDVLREADNVDRTRDLNLEDMTKKLPFVGKVLKNDQQKDLFQQYFREKIHKEVLKQTWKGDIKIKENLMITRQKQIEQIWHFEEEAKIKDKSILEIQADYMKLQGHSDDLRREIKSLHKHMQDMERKHRDDLKSQVSFNMANDRHLTRLNERAEDAGSYLATIMKELKQIMDYNERPARTAYENLMENYNKHLKMHKEITDTVERFREERMYLANQVAGQTIEDKQSIKPHFQSYIMRNEESNVQQEQKIKQLEENNKEKDKKLEELSWVQDRINLENATSNWQTSAKYALLQKKIDDAEGNSKVKDDKIGALEKHIKALLEKIKKLEAELVEAQKAVRDAKEAANKVVLEPIQRRPKTPPQITPAESIISTPPRDNKSRHSKKSTTSTTRSVGNFMMDTGNNGMGNTLDLIKGQGLNGGALPTGVMRIADGKKPIFSNPTTTAGSVTSNTPYSRRQQASKAVRSKRGY